MSAVPQFANDPERAIREVTQRIEPELIAVRRDLHAHPELAFEEVRTAGVVARELARLGIPHQTGVGRTGVVGLIEGGRPGPVLAIRADLDALPIEERTGLTFASTKPGLMHACGHDIHTTTLLGIGAVLKELAPRLAGSVKLVFQPAEETLGGARAMIAEGVLEAPNVDMAIGFHNMPNLPVGRFTYVRGAAMAAADAFDLTIHGKSGHAAYPETTVDPIVAAGAFIGQAQTVVSREVSALHPVVVTIGAIHGGTVRNIIPDEVLLRGSVRTLHASARAAAESGIRRLCVGLEAGMRVRCVLDYVQGVPPLTSDPGMLERTVASVRAQLGDVIAEEAPSMGSEDFALFAERVKSFHVRVGSSQPGREDRLHNSAYQPDEACIAAGVQALARAAVDLLS